LYYGIDDLDPAKKLIENFYQANSHDDLTVPINDALLNCISSCLSSKDHLVASTYIYFNSLLSGNEISTVVVAKHFNLSRGYISGNIKNNSKDFLINYRDSIKRVLSESISKFCIKYNLLPAVKEILTKMVSNLGDSFLLKKQRVLTPILINFIASKYRITISNELSKHFGTSRSNISTQMKKNMNYLEKLFLKSSST